ncbi:Stk1 family PASTA domain-containing Ser/Thr kinase [Bifidobacterium choloepi]|uniref:non-specific serine/threonine protein kinase n=1 Tax=Bifidobacterium choloepi TaxID=2614131 RepID=A0A6I5NDH5_9BIFI|nr:Stk1 family PASTA domain-containing Ser/Thr kinase [Bifidobacterium choloepi]NEG70590.1 Stk1 family PASTA domain-containing Ser/Thr kinase [Bifidobacterium choloepi]
MSSQMPATLDGGRYQLGQLVGRGGMAEVHVALDTRLGRTVAIKMMRADFANDEIFLTRFRREAHSVAQMNNPNIVNIYDSGEETIALDNGQTERIPYLVMEYVKGQTLRDIIKANGPLSQRDTEHVMIGLLSALEYSHRMGIIHRDIKPGNIMISEQGVVKVMDFGIARALDDSATTMTQSQGVVGTAQYLSPEQARGETVDMRSDLYSAGCVLYEMLTGRAPFTGDSAVAIAYQHVSEVATPPSAIVPGLPAMWDSICAKAMAKDRQNRYSTATQFKNDILTFMSGGQPVAAAVNPLTDLTATKAATTVMTPTAGEAGSTTTQFNPATGQFEQVPAAETTNTGTRLAARKEAEAKKRKKRIVVTVIVVCVLLVAGIVGGWLWWNSQRDTVTMVTVPTFNSTTTEDRAKQQLEALGLNIKVEEDTDSALAKGTFTKQSPAGGTSVAQGSTVTVWFSAGPASVSVPDVSGYSQDEARTTLENAGFTVSTAVQSEDSATIPKDDVTRTDPAAGTTVDKGSTIKLYVSTGMTTVPSNLVGMSQDDAITAIKNAGLTSSIESEYSDSVAAGNVISVSPSAGTTVSQGDLVTVTVSLGPEQVTIPTIPSGTTLASAKQILEASGFAVSVSGPSDDDAVVTNVSPAAGTTVDKGSTVTLTTQAASSGDESSSSSSSSSSESPSSSHSSSSSSSSSSSKKKD